MNNYLKELTDILFELKDLEKDITKNNRDEEEKLVGGIIFFSTEPTHSDSGTDGKGVRLVLNICQGTNLRELLSFNLTDFLSYIVIAKNSIIENNVIMEAIDFYSHQLYLHSKKQELINVFVKYIKLFTMSQLKQMMII